MSNTSAFPDWHGTTILAVRKGGKTVVAGDGQVSMGPTIVKGTAKKVRKLAGPTMDPDVVADTALALFDALGDERPVRLLGVRAEMEPPEGGY